MVLFGPSMFGSIRKQKRCWWLCALTPGVDFCAPSVCGLAGVHGVGIEDTGEFDFELDGAVLVEDPVDAVLVVSGCEDV